MRTIACPARFRILRVTWLLGLIWSWALVSQEQDNPPVHLMASQVHADTMQRLGRGLRWHYQPGQPAGWASPATDDRAWPFVDASFRLENSPPGWRGTGCFRIWFTL